MRAARYGAVFPFPSSAAAVLEMIDGIIAGRLPVRGKSATPASFFPATAVRQGAAILALNKPVLAVAE